ncbi:hypothetical protein EIP91_004934 [Steccherinum ochraceum]|uniref:JmjC domain-containing protein n=1 Tax=Steccherinum ochraceum TaxID=92696 RepID=A0A4R0R8L0_9APHY|nr:hypothetical protein EIP91_004934 [Steccherinum ochraceum]
MADSPMKSMMVNTFERPPTPPGKKKGPGTNVKVDTTSWEPKAAHKWLKKRDSGRDSSQRYRDKIKAEKAARKALASPNDPSATLSVHREQGGSLAQAIPDWTSGDAFPDVSRVYREHDGPSGREIVLGFDVQAAHESDGKRKANSPTPDAPAPQKRRQRSKPTVASFSAPEMPIAGPSSSHIAPPPSGRTSSPYAFSLPTHPDATSSNLIDVASRSRLTTTHVDSGVPPPIHPSYPWYGQGDAARDASFVPMPAFSTAAHSDRQDHNNVGVQTEELTPATNDTSVQTEQSIPTSHATSVQTDAIPPPPPRADQPGSYAYTEDPLRPKDLRSWQGQPYKSKAEDVFWPGGWVTKAPYQEDPKRPGVNIIPHDTKHTQLLARKVNDASQGSKYVQVFYYDKAEDPETCARKFARLLAEGISLHLIGFPKLFEETYLKWTIESFYSWLGVSKSQPYEAQDAFKRTNNGVKNENKPIHRNTQMEDFLDDVNLRAETVTSAIMDAPAVKSNVPLFVGALDHGHTAHMRNFHGDMYRRSIPSDVHHSENWCLYHTGGYFTYTHKDAEALGTWIRIVSGVKGWIFINTDDVKAAKNRKTFEDACEKVEANSVHCPDGVHRDMVWAYPGDILIQAPGQYHEVFTPIPTVTTGGHFYSLETMHLTEVELYYQHCTNATDTNHRHHSASLTAVMMINSLKDKGPQWYPKKSLMGLCLLITSPDTHYKHVYRDPDWHFRVAMQRQAAKKKKVKALPDVERMNDGVQALANARILQEKLGFEYTFKLNSKNKKYSNYAFSGKGLYDPGERVFLTADILDMFNQPVPDRQGEVHYDSSDYGPYKRKLAPKHPKDSSADDSDESESDTPLATTSKVSAGSSHSQNTLRVAKRARPRRILSPEAASLEEEEVDEGDKGDVEDSDGDL